MQRVGVKEEGKNEKVTDVSRAAKGGRRRLTLPKSVEIGLE